MHESPPPTATTLAPHRSASIWLFCVGVVIYGVFTFGGIRSPDSELVYRCAQSIAASGRFEIREELPWRGFGVARGVDGRLYTVFGPAESVALVPFVWLAKQIATHSWLRGSSSLPQSRYLAIGQTQQHAERTVASLFNVIVGATTVLLFFLLLRRLSGSVRLSAQSAALFGFGSLIFPYSGTFFSEPLAMVWLLLSLLNALPAAHSDTRGWQRHTLAGFFLGLSTLTHVSAVLFAPFLFVIVGYRSWQASASRKTTAHSLLAFSLAFGVMLGLLGLFNYLRFGNLLETGRTVSASVVYSTWVTPWRGLAGLLWSSGKGLLLYSPIVALGLAAWPSFVKRDRVVALTLLAAIVFRLLFIACRSDWHGGFCLGPRLLLLTLPLLLLPLPFAIETLHRRSKHAGLLLGVTTVMLIGQQLYFALGDVFDFLHAVKQLPNLTFNWDASPLPYLLESDRGPALLQWIPLSNSVLFALLLVPLVVVVALLQRYAWPR